jgi:alkylation response protein AidB-like acyl-CoA dehydrogenase
MDAAGSTAGEALLQAARELGPFIRACADEIERERRLPQRLVDRLVAAGLFKMTVATSFGGAEADPETIVRVIEEVSRADGSTGWCVTVPTQEGLYCAFLREDVASELFGGDPAAYVAGGVAPIGRAVAVEGGFRVTGRWRYNSGCAHATWLVCLCIVHDVGPEGSSPRLDAEGEPLQWYVYVPAADCWIIDTWHVTGLRGTGSHDVAVEDVFVPQDRSVAPRFVGPAREPSALYRFGRGLLPITFAAVSLGIARGAIDAFVELLTRPESPKSRLGESPRVLAQLSQAEARLRAARALLFEAVREAWATVCEPDVGLPEERRMALQLASAHAATASAQVVEMLWYAYGSSAIFAGNPLERRFRDAHTAAQRFNAAVYEQAGRMLLTADALSTGAAGPQGAGSQ